MLAARRAVLPAAAVSSSSSAMFRAAAAASAAATAYTVSSDSHRAPGACRRFVSRVRALPPTLAFHGPHSILRGPLCSPASAATYCSEVSPTGGGCPFSQDGGQEEQSKRAAPAARIHEAARVVKDPLQEPVEGRDFAVFRRPPGTTPAPGDLAAAESTLEELLDFASGSSASSRPNVILLGEVHDDPVAHRLQLRILQHCAKKCLASGRRVVLSLEMFEADVQRVLDEYVLLKAIRE
ncbi:unnamed protein product, partial [Polarella glacialis]